MQMRYYLKPLSLLIAGLISVSPASGFATKPEEVFQILASEIALQRGEASAAYQTYMSLAKSTKDFRMAQRAMEIAIAGNAADLALEAARTFDELNPKEGKDIFVTLLMLNQRWSESIGPARARLLASKTVAEQEKLIAGWREILNRFSSSDAAWVSFFEIVLPSYQKIKDNDLLYTFALSAEKANRIGVMENALKQILKKEPNNVSALNALGYSYADRGILLNDAYNLINKAHQLKPDDPYILDSLAWVNYRLGKNQLALSQLKKAFSMKPEAEIGAHLGEVHFVLGERDAAERIWRASEELDASNKTLLETIQRLQPDRVPVKQNKLWDGRFAVKVTANNQSQQGGTGSFTLSHDGQFDILDLRNPVGGALAKITIGPSSAKLDDGKGVYEAHDADTLVQNYLGLPLPARGLANWLSGLPRIGASSTLTRDAMNRTQRLIQDNWEMTYQWNDKHQLLRMDLKRINGPTQIDVRLIFDPIDE